MASGAPCAAPHWRVERAGAGAAAALGTLGAAALSRGWSRPALEAELLRPEALVWVARPAGGLARAEPVGFLLARLAAGELHVLLLAVVEGVRRRGVGSALLETALEAAHRAGAPVAHLEVRAANRVAQAFYRHHGFEVVGRRRRYYEGRQDAVLMTRMLA